MTPIVLDLYHGDAVVSFSAAKEAGILGIIHKASEHGPDPLYEKRRQLAASAGLLWGAYHFNTAESAAVQVNRFFAAAKPDTATRMCLDFETNVMQFGTMLEFLDQMDQRTQRYGTLYSGNRIKETIVHATDAQRDFLAKHPFWLAQYGPHARMVDVNHHPLPWPSYDLWQYAADGIPHPNHIPGIPVPGVDVNTYNGSVKDLTETWPGAAISTR